MNVYREELRTQARATLGWAVAMLAAVGVFLGIYPAFAQQMESLRVLVQGFGKLATRALGMDILLLPGILGFFSFLQLYVIVIGAIQAMLLGAGLVARERRNKTADFLFAKPASRLGIYSEKLLAALTLIVLTNAAYLAVSLGFAQVVAASEAFPMDRLLLIALSMLWTQLFFAALGFLVAVLMRRLKSPFTLALSTVFGLFIVALIAALLEEDALRYLTPFRYFDGVSVLLHGGYDPALFGLGLALTVLMTAGGLFAARRLDLPAL